MFVPNSPLVHTIQFPSSMTGSGNPCGACKFLRRKCAADCIFAPYFGSEDSSAQFAEIHKIFGASNMAKLLHSIPATYRSEAVVTAAYEAQARLRDPVYGCVRYIFDLQRQVAILQAQVIQAKALVARSAVASQEQWQGFSANPFLPGYSSWQSSLECISYCLEDMPAQGMYFKEEAVLP